MLWGCFAAGRTGAQNKWHHEEGTLCGYIEATLLREFLSMMTNYVYISIRTD
jgi:hypothetical protein